MQYQGHIYTKVLKIWGFPGGSDSKESTCNVGEESTCNVEDLGLIPGLGRFPGEWNSYPLQYYGLDNSRDCIVHGIL